MANYLLLLLPGKRQWFIVVTKGRSRPDGTFHKTSNNTGYWQQYWYNFKLLLGTSNYCFDETLNRNWVLAIKSFVFNVIYSTNLARSVLFGSTHAKRPGQYKLQCHKEQQPDQYQLDQYRLDTQILITALLALNIHNWTRNTLIVHPSQPLEAEKLMNTSCLPKARTILRLDMWTAPRAVPKGLRTRGSPKRVDTNLSFYLNFCCLII